MSECKYKAKDGECLYEKRFPYKEYCVEGPCTHDTPQTNADRIRAMSDEELAELLYSVWKHEKGWYQRCHLSLVPFFAWLKQEVRE